MTRHRLWFNELFTSTGFRGPVLTLLSGSSVALALAYVATPVLTRLYTPAAFGVSDYFITILSLFIAFTSLRYEDALMQPEDEEEAAGVLWLCAGLVLLAAALCMLALPWRQSIANVLGVPDLAPWLFLLPPTLIAMRWAKFAELWLTRHRRFRTVTAGQVGNVATMVTTRIGVGIAPFQAGAGGLIGGYTLGHFAALLIYGAAAFRHAAATFRKALRPALWRKLAVRYRRFPLFSMPSALMNALLARLPYLFIPIYFDEEMLGLFGRAFVVLAIPLSFIGGAIAQVFFVQAAEALREDDLPRLTRTVHARLVMIGIFPTLALILAGPDLLHFLLGEAWRDAGVFIRYVGLWFFLAAVASPLTRLFDVLERQRLDLLTSIFMFIILSAALVIGGSTGDFLTLLLWTGSAGVLVRIVHLAVMLHLGNVTWVLALHAYGKYFLFSLPGLLLVLGAMQTQIPLITTIAAGIGGVCYAMLVLWRDQLFALDR